MSRQLKHVVANQIDVCLDQIAAASELDDTQPYAAMRKIIPKAGSRAVLLVVGKPEFIRVSYDILTGACDDADD